MQCIADLVRSLDIVGSLLLDCQCCIIVNRCIGMPVTSRYRQACRKVTWTLGPAFSSNVLYDLVSHLSVHTMPVVAAVAAVAAIMVSLKLSTDGHVIADQTTCKPCISTQANSGGIVLSMSNTTTLTLLFTVWWRSFRGAPLLIPHRCHAPPSVPFPKLPVLLQG